MDMEFKYDIAFSFLYQDEPLAVELYSILCERLSCFIYTEEQKKLAGTDGEKTFNSVFAEESRIVVILYREGWGETPWSRIEETAIRNRGYEDGYDFAIMIPLASKPSAPKWLPKNRLWIGLKRWGVDGAASVIEARAQEFGGEIREVSISDKIEIVERQQKQKEDIERYLSSAEAKKDSFSEFRSILSSIEKETGQIKSRTPDWHLHLRENKQNGIDLLSYGYQLSFQYYTDPIKPYMFIVLFRGYFDKNGTADPFNKPETVLLNRYSLDKNSYNYIGWSDRDTRENFMVSNEVIEYWLNRLIEYATENRQNHR